MRYRFPYVGADLRKIASCQTPAYSARPRIRLVYQAMCLFTSPAFAGYSPRQLTEGWLRLSTPGCLMPRWFTLS